MRFHGAPARLLRAADVGEADGHALVACLGERAHRLEGRSALPTEPEDRAADPLEAATICTKARWWGTTIPQRAFRLLAGEDALSTYNFRPGATLLHHFCRLCGVRVMITGYVEELGGDIVTLQVATLDDVEPAELLEAPISYLDGKNDAWWNPPAEFRHL